MTDPLSGEVPDPADPPSGCRFHTRCPAIIPPEGMDVEQAAYRGVTDLRLALAAGEVDVATLRERLEDPSDAGLRARLRERYDIPERLGDADAERVLAAALDRLVEGDPEAALERLEPTFVSICEREAPATHETSAGEAACHRHR